MAVKLLSALDTARTQYYHFKAIIVAGMGLFSDSYDLFCIPSIMKLLARIYYESSKKKYQIPTSVSYAMLGVPLLGTAIGQLVFGLLGDRRGRRSVYGLALMIMVLSSLSCGFSICRTRTCVLSSLGFFRFVLGLGIGGDYPLSATIMSEFANKMTRGAFIAAVFSMQGFGILASSAVTMVVSRLFELGSKNLTNDHTPATADLSWRLILMFGAFPAALTFYWRMMMPETARYTALVENNVLQAAKDMEKVMSISMSPITEEEPLPPSPPSYPLFSQKFLLRHGLDLFSCSLNWFLLDIAFYGSNLLQSQIYIQFWKLNNENVYGEAFKVAALQAIVASCSTIPGYFFTVYLIDRVGRRRIQIIGFLCMGIIYLALGISYSYWHDHKNIGFMLLYGLTFFFANFGPNTTTFIVPAELFPARFRSTCQGISGAMGKMGALVGTLVVLWASTSDDDDQSNVSAPSPQLNNLPKVELMKIALLILGGVCLLGMTVTVFFTSETKGRSLEENENEEENSNHEMSFFRCFAGTTDANRRTKSNSREVTPL